MEDGVNVTEKGDPGSFVTWSEARLPMMTRRSLLAWGLAGEPRPRRLRPAEEGEEGAVTISDGEDALPTPSRRSVSATAGFSQAEGTEITSCTRQHGP